jgi:hypothetical protein
VAMGQGSTVAAGGMDLLARRVATAAEQGMVGTEGGAVGSGLAEAGVESGVLVEGEATVAEAGVESGVLGQGEAAMVTVVVAAEMGMAAATKVEEVMVVAKAKAGAEEVMVVAAMEKAEAERAAVVMAGVGMEASTVVMAEVVMEASAASGAVRTACTGTRRN